jgi:small GTP-binding protein
MAKKKTAAKKKVKRKPKEGEIPAGFKLRCVLRGHTNKIGRIAWSPDGRRIASPSDDMTIRIWDAETKRLIRRLEGSKRAVISVSWSPDGRWLASGSLDNTVRLWDAESGNVLRTLKGHEGFVYNVSWAPDGGRIASGSGDNRVRLWDAKTGKLLRVLKGNANGIISVAWSPDGRLIASGAGVDAVGLWDGERGELLRMLEGHSDFVYCVAWSPDGQMIASGGSDATVRIWEAETGRKLQVLEGHTESVRSVCFSADGELLASKSDDGTVRIWQTDSWVEVAQLGESSMSKFGGLSFHPAEPILATLGEDKKRKPHRFIRIWELDLKMLLDKAAVSLAVRYTNAKVVLVGESGVGKTALGHRLAENKWQMTESTHGMKVWLLELGRSKGKQKSGQEVWLWDLAGQPDYRLVHQLYFDETALALMLINPAHPEDPFREVGEWEKGMRTALGYEPKKLLVAARVDRGGATISKEKIEEFCKRRDYAGYFETSAKLGDGCTELKEALAKHIPWDRLPSISTTKVFKVLKDAIIRLKGEKIVLIQFSALQKQVEKDLGKKIFKEAELKTVVRLLASQGLVKQLAFGDFVLLQPEQINNYASAVVREARANVDGVGAVKEDGVLDAQIDFKGMERVKEKDEEILLRAMVQMFLEQSLCIREETPEGIQLVFPSQFKREMPEIPEYPNICVKYKFGGNLAAIYATLVVRLIYSKGFEKKDLWRNAAEFLTPEGKRIGFVMKYLGEGTGEITVFFEEGVPDDSRVTFIKYIHEHLLRRAVDVERQREYVCPKCNKGVENREAVKFRLYGGKKDVGCVHCDARIPLYDLIEKKFNKDEFLRKVQELDAQAEINLDNESRELILVGHMMTTCAEGGQIYRGYTNSDHGIDGEIEFKDKKGKATGKKAYVQLKSGDSYTYERKKDEKEIFTIKNERHIEYWQNQVCEVYLVHRRSDGVIRWMNVSEYLRKRKDKEKKQIVFEGEPFTVHTLRKLRDEYLGSNN